MIREVPVTLVTGFLESGKTTALKGILERGFGDFSGVTLLIDSEEESIETYDTEVLKKRNVVLVDIDGPFLLTHEYLSKLDEQYHPVQVFLEYNGLASVRYLDKLKWPQGWAIARQMTVFDAGVFALYEKRLSTNIRDMVKNTTVILFNRTEDVPGKGTEADRKEWNDYLHGINPDAAIFYE